MSLNKPGVVYDTAKLPDLRDIPVMAGCDADTMPWQKKALKSHTSGPDFTPILTRTGYQYRTTWVKGVPISHKGEIQVHVHHHLGIESRLAAHKLVGLA